MRIPDTMEVIMWFAARNRALPLIALWLCLAPVTLAEVTRTLRGELTTQSLQRFAVENLAGIMRIRPGTGNTVIAIATVHAESEALATLVRLEQLTGEGGISTLSVRYPLDRERTIRYPDPRYAHDWEFPDLFSSSTTYRYGDQTVRVSRHHGVLLYADVEVQVPPGRLDATFRNLVGGLEAQGLEGRLRFEVESADLRLDSLSGDLELEGSSGDTRASDIRASWKSDFSSGDCVLDRFEGDLLSFHMDSGDIRARSVKARRVQVRTSSGDARIRDADIEEFSANASSGDIELDTSGAGLKLVRVETSSGDVALRLPSETSFDAQADQSSGDLRVGFSDGSAVWHRDKLTAYRRGNGGTRIQLQTSSGDAVIEPR
jgi:hypothetical protein